MVRFRLSLTITILSGFLVACGTTQTVDTDNAAAAERQSKNQKRPAPPALRHAAAAAVQAEKEDGNTVVADAGKLTVPGCLVSLTEEAKVPAKEAGVIASLKVKEGQSVKKGDVLAQLDSRRARIAEAAAREAYNEARTRADSDISVRYSRAAAAVAKQDLQKAIEANKTVPGTVPQSEIRRLELEFKRAELQIEQSLLEQALAQFTVKTRKAEFLAAQENVQRRKITSPIAGIVESIQRENGEWVNPGDPVFQMLRMDRLRIEGFFSANEVLPQRVHGRTVTVKSVLAGGRRKQFKGKVVFVSAQVHAGDKFRVWAEVDNRKLDGHWLLRPGLLVTLTID